MDNVLSSDVEAVKGRSEFCLAQRRFLDRIFVVDTLCQISFPPYFLKFSLKFAQIRNFNKLEKQLCYQAILIENVEYSSVV